MLILTQRRRIVKPTPGEVWLHGNPHPLAKGLVFAGGISSDHGGDRYFDFAKKQHGALTNMDPATDWVAGPNGWALDFDASNDRIDMPNEIYSAYTFVARLSVASLASTRSIYTKWGSSNAWLFDITSSQVRLANSDGVGTSTFQTTETLSTNRWYFLAGVWSGGTTGTNAFLYIDGRLSRSGTLSRTVQNSANVVNIGAFNNSTNLFSGQISSFLAYNRALAPSELAELYQDHGFSWATRPRRRVFGFTASGGTTFNESGDLSAIPSLTSSETLTLSESGTLSAIPTLAANQTVSLSGVGDLSAVPSLTADQTIAVNESGDLSGVPSITGDVANAFDESATLSGIPSLTGDHTYTLQGGSTLSAVPSLTADQTVTMNLSGELSAIPSLTGVDTGLAGVTAFNGGGRSEFVGPPARSSQFRSGRNNVSEFRTGRWVN